MYADWKAQVAYTTPNFSGFQATVGLTQAFDAQAVNAVSYLDDSVVSKFAQGTFHSSVSTQGAGAAFGYEGKASYSFAVNDVTGKIWVSGISQKLQDIRSGSDLGTRHGNVVARAGDIGANINFAGFGLTGYYGAGEGTGTTVQFRDGIDNNGKKRDSNDWYLQATYVLPTKTKVGLSYGESTLESNGGTDYLSKDYENNMWTAGLYHPLTKHLNLVAEYSSVESSAAINNGAEINGRSRTGSLGAILFF
jgi:hypothetical protein